MCHGLEDGSFHQYLPPVITWSETRLNAETLYFTPCSCAQTCTSTVLVCTFRNKMWDIFWREEGTRWRGVFTCCELNTHLLLKQEQGNSLAGVGEMLWTCTPEAFTSHLGRGSCYADRIHVVFPVPPRKCRDNAVTGLPTPLSWKFIILESLTLFSPNPEHAFPSLLLSPITVYNEALCRQQVVWEEMPLSWVYKGCLRLKSKIFLRYLLNLPGQDTNTGTVYFYKVFQFYGSSLVDVLI
jgi:hypothetical protein